MHFVLPQFNFWTDLILIAGIVFVIQGIIYLVRGTIKGMGFEAYTEKSKKIYAKQAGVCYIVMGAVLALCQFITFDVYQYLAIIIAGIIFVAALIASLVLAQKTLKKR